jgi:hypothetical protein
MVGMHAMRKTYATMLAQTGTPIRVAMDILRVTDVKLLTETYTDALLLNTAAARDSPTAGRTSGRGSASDR